MTAVVFVAALLLAPVSASAAPGPSPVTVRVTLAAQQPATPNYVTVVVTLTDRRTGRPPAETYVVFGQASNAFDEQTDPGPCTSRSYQTPDAPAGVFDCTVIIDHGGKWLFEGIVNRVSAQGRPVEVARGGVVLDIRAGTLLSAGRPPSRNIAAKRSDVLALIVHLTATTAWILSVLALALLSVPQGRRLLSQSAVHWLEIRRARLVKAMWASTLLTLGTGVLLMSRQTAYATPTSTRQLRAVEQLPYGRAYFAALAVKIAIFMVMVMATLVFARESSRLARAATTSGAGRAAVARSPWAESTVSDGGTRTRTAVLSQVESGSSAPVPGSRLLPMAATILLVGLVGIEISVVLLKYFHELVEATGNVGLG